MATQDAADGQVEAAQWAMFLDGFDGILAAGGCEATRGRRQGRDESLIEADG